MSNIINAYAAYAKKDNIRMNSSSGGVFSVLAKYILKHGGIVYGVAMSEDCLISQFLRIDTEDNLHKIRGSKYVQAKMGNVYKQVENDLKNNLLVLFSGVGCQINGLIKYLGKEYPTLICIDVVCHGVPSPKLWEKYAKSIEEKYKKELDQVEFRYKKIRNKNKSKDILFIPKSKDPYMLIFLDNYCLRPSCYSCIAKKIKLSDISLADFWGIERVAPEISDGKGTSLIITRTRKGEKLLEQVSEDLKIEKVSYEDGIKENSAEYKSVECPPERKAFFEQLDENSFEQLARQYAIPVKKSVKLRIYLWVKNLFAKVCGKEIGNSDFGMLFKFK